MKVLFPEFPIRASSTDYHLRERAEKYGVETMETTELLELLLGSSRRRRARLRDAIVKVRLRDIVALHQQEIAHVCGLTTREAFVLRLVLELAKRLDSESRQPRPTINSPGDVAELLMPEMRHLDREHLRVVCLDTKNRVNRVVAISVGTLSSSLAHPREVFRSALLTAGTASIILVHNHPSGDPAPSREDIELTKQLMRAGEVVGIEVLDHVIVGLTAYASLRERNLI